MKRRSIFSILSTIAAMFCGKAVAKVEVPASSQFGMSEIDKLWLKESARMLEEWDKQTKLRMEKEMMKPWSPYENQGTVVWRNTYKS